MVLISATCWGLSGTASQFLFNHAVVSPSELVTIRMVLAGLLLVLGGMLKKPSTTRIMLRDRQSWMALVTFAVIGLFGVQYTYFKAIDDGNAASATLLQYLGPPFIVLYSALREGHRPANRQTLALALALIGTVMLATGGHINHFKMPIDAIMWGLLSALCLAFYTLYPSPLIKQFDSLSVVGVGMLLGGIVSYPLMHPILFHWSLFDWGLVGFVVVFGTLVSFWLYLSSLNYLTASETGLLASTEPFAAVMAAVLLLHVRLNPFDIAGAVLILLAVIELARPSKKEHPRPAVFHRSRNN